jgi:hypothetical protein
MGVRKTKASRNRSGRWPAGWSDDEWSRLLFGAFAKFRKATISFVMSVRLSAWQNWSATGRVLMKCDFGVFLQNISTKIHVSLQSHNNNGTPPADRYTVLIITRSVLLVMQNPSDKSCRENKTTHFVFSDFFFLENRAVCEIM